MAITISPYKFDANYITRGDLHCETSHPHIQLIGSGSIAAEDIDVKGDGATKIVANSETELAQATEALENYHKGEQNSGNVTYIIVPLDTVIDADNTAAIERLLREGRQAGLRVVVLAGDTALTPAEGGVLLPHLAETINLG